MEAMPPLSSMDNLHLRFLEEKETTFHSDMKQTRSKKTQIKLIMCCPNK